MSAESIGGNKRDQQITAAATALSFTFENSIVLLILYKEIMGFKKGLKACL